MLGDFFTKALQGSPFKKFRDLILNLDVNITGSTPVVSQECVEISSKVGLSTNEGSPTKPRADERRPKANETESSVQGWIKVGYRVAVQLSERENT